jgi:hypothetical protein
MENYPQCDAEVRKLAAELWGQADTKQAGERRFGQGRLIWGQSLEKVFAALNSPPDFESSTQLRFTHRRSGGTDIYFVANPKAESLTTTAAFRAGDKAPELWWPDSGKLEQPAVYNVAGGVVRMPLSFGPNGSVFVVFREPAAPAAERIVSVTRNGREVLGTKVTPASAGAGGDSPNNFTFAAWIKPAAATTLVREANRGIVGMSEPRNDALAAPHGDSLGGSGHAGCGLAVGTNGVCVIEHGASYFAPTLVHAAPLTDWTHLAVVYRDGQPSLYLNGSLVRTGLKSEHIVHPGAGAGGLPNFHGQLGGFAQFTRALSANEVAELVQTMRRPDPSESGPPIQFTQQGRHWTALATIPGDYELTFADGRTSKLNVAQVPPPQALAGAWEVQFPASPGKAERVIFNQLEDWTKRPEENIKHYSGKATYRKTFRLDPSSISTSKSQIRLNLGEVRDLATVRVNGKDLGTLWLAPWQMDVTAAVKPGENTIEIEVVNVWNNRLVADAARPAEDRQTFLLASTVKRGSPLLPAGLLGPVTLSHMVEIQSK